MRPRPPFDFVLSCAIMEDGDAQIQSCRDGRAWKVMRLPQQKLVLTVITGSGTVESPGLQLELTSPGVLTAADRAWLRGAVRNMFSLDVDLEAFYAGIRADPLLAAIAARLRGLRNPTTATPFEALVYAIVEQQISLVAAHSMERRVIRRYGEEFEGIYAFPTPAQLAAASLPGLRGCGLSQRKAEYILGLSQMVAAAELDLDSMAGLPSAQLTAQLMQLRGVGRWTAEMSMLRGMHKTDVLPADDLGLRRLVSHYYNHDVMMSNEQVREVGTVWGDWCGLAAYYLVVAYLKGIEPDGLGLAA